MVYLTEIDDVETYYTGKRGAPEYINYDCPDIYVELEWDDGSKHWTKILELGFYGTWVSDELTLEERMALVAFIKRSEIAFNKKYPQCGGNMRVTEKVTVAAEQAGRLYHEY